MECPEFKKNIEDFAELRLDYETAQECLNHVVKCPYCRDELEIYFIVEHGISENSTYKGAFVINNIIEDCFNNNRQMILNNKTKHNAIELVKTVLCIVFIIAIITIVTVLV